VFPNAFTLYGGTGMSLPAIWTGSASLHRQYIKPFWPMNTLEKLLDANRYRRVMSVDIIMEQLLKPAEPPTELDRGRRTMEYELCRTLDELETRLTESASDPRPVFGYSLPQDLHVSNIVSAAVPGGGNYPGFHAPYAARVRQIDGCFGRFIEYLKRRGWYDRSVIVVTADHGEMLGEEGLWGHVYYMFPPVDQVPLIIHLPAGTPRPAQLDRSNVSLTIDITPTIYAALGYEPRRGTPLMGRPLFGPTADAPVNEERADHVLAASYGAVYAVLRDHGRRLYIVDAVQHKEYAYERPNDGLPPETRGPHEDSRWASVPVTPGIREAGQRLIREHMYEVNRVYRARSRQ
jgi:membrane-anchored protein YejM (alkaline phosphatase superfamily)